MDPFAALRAEWPVIQQAPWTVVLVVIVTFSIAYFAAKWRYSKDISEAHALHKTIEERLKLRDDQIAIAERQMAAARASPEPVRQPPAPEPQDRVVEPLTFRVGSSPSAPADKAMDTREYLPKGFTESYMKLLREPHTDLQMKGLLLPHEGKWMSLSAYMADVREVGDDLMAFFSQEQDTYTGPFYAVFGKAWLQRLARLNPYEALRFDAQICESWMGMVLENAEVR